jgi:plasmid stabilization system protein ParE
LTNYRLIAGPPVDRDVAAAFEWYQNEQPGLGLEFLEELRASYDRMAAGPLQYSLVRDDIRRALLKRFPYAVYFAVEADQVVVVSVLHERRNPMEWQRRRR